MLKQQTADDDSTEKNQTAPGLVSACNMVFSCDQIIISFVFQCCHDRKVVGNVINYQIIIPHLLYLSGDADRAGIQMTFPHHGATQGD